MVLRGSTTARRAGGLWFVLALWACGGGGSNTQPDVATDTHPLDAREAGAMCTTAADCDDGMFCNGAESCSPHATGADARGCVRPSAPCTAAQTCDETRDACQTSCATPDADGDGHRAVDCGGDDCDDTDPNRFPGNTEVCAVASVSGDDGGTRFVRTDTANHVDPTHDEDCDPSTYANGVTHDGDHDGDGYVDIACTNTDRSGMTFRGTDCQDLDDVPGSAAAVHPADIHPNQPEVCDGVDNNCNGVPDEGVSMQYYADCDGDGYGDTQATAMIGCGGAQLTACMGHPPVADHGDCNDALATVHPGAAEVCDIADGGPAHDENCNGSVNEGCDCTVGETRMCCGGRATQTCVGGAFSPCPVTMMAEVCNGVDDDCDGTVDNGVLPRACYDGTAATMGVGVCHGGVQMCTGGAYGSCVGEVVPSSEACNGLDDNCNGAVDDGAMGTFYRDGDGDGYGNAGASVRACTAPAGYVASNTDCDDGNGAAHPGASPNCNITGDLNCNGHPDSSEWTPCSSASDPAHTTFNGCVGHQCAGAGACVVLGADTPYRHDSDHDGACVPANDQFCTGYPLGAEWRPTSLCGGTDDCNDADPQNYPGHGEQVDGRDNNCSGTCDEGLGNVVYSLWNPGDVLDNMLSFASNEAGWSGRDRFFTYNAPNGYTVGSPMIRCVEPSGRHYITAGDNNCPPPNFIEGRYGYVLAGPHNHTFNLRDCYIENRGGWAEMTAEAACSSWAAGQGVPWVEYPGGYGYVVADGCWGQ